MSATKMSQCEQVCECAPEGADKLAESGPAVRLEGPASGEQVVNGGRAELRFGKTNARLQLGDDLSVLQPKEWLLGHGEDLPHAHTWLNAHIWLTYFDCLHIHAERG